MATKTLASLQEAAHSWFYELFIFIWCNSLFHEDVFFLFFLEPAGDMKELIFEYFQLFGDKSVCFSDLCVYMDLLDSTQKLEVCIRSFFLLNFSSSRWGFQMYTKPSEPFFSYLFTVWIQLLFTYEFLFQFLESCRSSLSSSCYGSISEDVSFLAIYNFLFFFEM